jgi:hypothetical protein
VLPGLGFYVFEAEEFVVSLILPIKYKTFGSKTKDFIANAQETA